MPRRRALEKHGHYDEEETIKSLAKRAHLITLEISALIQVNGALAKDHFFRLDWEAQEVDRTTQRCVLRETGDVLFKTRGNRA